MSFHVIHLPEEQRKDTCVWGVVLENKVIAKIETTPEKEKNLLYITEFWVTEEYRSQGIGHALLAVVKEQAELERRKAVVMELPCESETVESLLAKDGFTLSREATVGTPESVREWRYVRTRKRRLSVDEVEIRKELPEEYHAVERVAQEAFWNRHHQGCDEHYLVHKLRESSDYLPKLSRIALVDGEIVGVIMYSKAEVRDGENTAQIITFGPLCVKPEWYGCGIGEFCIE